MTELEKYYNKFNEDKRLTTRHGKVEFITSMKYIHQCLEGKRCAKILDVGAGTGRYSVALANEGHNVTAIEPVKHNLQTLKAKSTQVKAIQGNALNLKKFENNYFDVTLLFGPMYHLFGKENKLKAFAEAKRVTKKGGYILVAYCMNDYAVITYAFKDKNVKRCLENGTLTEDFHCCNSEKDLYDYVTLSDIDKLNSENGLKRVKIVAADGAADYIRPYINALDEDEFELFIKYHLSVCERSDLLGASSHTIDILLNE